MHIQRHIKFSMLRLDRFYIDIINLGVLSMLQNHPDQDQQYIIDIYCILKCVTISDSDSYLVGVSRIAGQISMGNQLKIIYRGLC